MRPRSTAWTAPRCGTSPRRKWKAGGRCSRSSSFSGKHAPGFQNAYVSGMPAVIGVRETRRIRGVESLAVEDCSPAKSPRAVVRGASFPIDIHNPDGIGQAQGVSAAHPLGKDPEVKPYDIPYGCLVPRSVNGLLVAGRCISGSHEAMASYRVQVIAMATGVAAGVAAAQAAQQDNRAARGRGFSDPKRCFRGAGLNNAVVEALSLRLFLKPGVPCCGHVHSIALPR